MAPTGPRPSRSCPAPTESQTPETPTARGSSLTPSGHAPCRARVLTPLRASTAARVVAVSDVVLRRRAHLGPFRRPRSHSSGPGGSLGRHLDRAVPALGVNTRYARGLTRRPPTHPTAGPWRGQRRLGITDDQSSKPPRRPQCADLLLTALGVFDRTYVHRPPWCSSQARRAFPLH